MTELRNGTYSLDSFLQLHEAIAEMAIKDKEEAEKFNESR